MKKRSLVLVTVDCLRADHVGFQGYSRPVTPFLDSLAKESVAFSTAIVAGAPTYFSFPGIMASRHPLGLGREVLGIAPNEPTLATVLKDSGCVTGAFLAGNPYLSARFGYDQGFERFRDFLQTALPEQSPATAPRPGRWSDLNRRIEAVSRHTTLTAAAYEELYFWYCQWHSGREEVSMDQLRRYPAANVIVDEAMSWLSGLRDDRFFLWLHLMDPHHPYYPPQEALSSLGLSRVSPRRARFLNSFWNRGDVGPLRLERYREEIVSLYDAGLHWVDRQISRLVEFLRQRERWQETVFVVTADHGEEFLEHGARYHSPVGLPEQLIHVPLLIHAPEIRGAVCQAPFSLVQLAPTLVEAVGAEAPASFLGKSCWEGIKNSDLPGGPTVSECLDGCNNPFQIEDRLRPRLLAVRDRRYKLVIRFGEGREALYDLSSDPQERFPLGPEVQVAERVRLLQVAREHLRRTARNRNSGLAISARLRELRQSMDLKGEHACAAEVAGLSA